MSTERSSVRKRSARRLPVAVMCAAVLFGASAFPSSGADGASRELRSSVKPSFATATYSLKDIGAPPTSYRAFTQPLGFNKTNQFVGEGYPASPPASSYQHCIAYTGTAWVDLIGANSKNCYATSGISDASAQGVFATAGGTFVPTNSQEVAFYAVVSPTSATVTTFPSYATSELWAMNATGLAVGNSYYVPVAGFDYSAPPFTSTGTAMNLLQPGCTTARINCMAYPYYFAGQSGQSRTINAAGTVFGYGSSQASGQFVEFTGGAHQSYVQFSIPLNAGNGASNIRGIDDAGNVVYEQYDPTAKKYDSWTYSPTARTAHQLGYLAGNSCTQYTPLWINGPGRVLGLAQSCSFPSDQTYWTWDTKHGMVAVSFSHTGYSAATIYLMNDLGKIAVDLSTTAGVHHWGYLTPPTGF